MSNQLLLRFRKVGALLDKCGELLWTDANVDCRATDIAAYRDPACVCLNLSTSELARRAHQQYRTKGEGALQGLTFPCGFSSPLVLIVVPVTFPPTATPPLVARMLGGGPSPVLSGNT